MKIFNLLLIAWVILLGSCKKDSYNTVVIGKVIHSSSKLPIEGVTVVIENEVSFNPSHLDSTVTDANGNFHIELSNENGAWVYLKKKGFTFHYSSLDNVVGYLTSYPNGITNNIVLEMYSEARFRGVLQSTNPSIDDTLYFSSAFAIQGNNWHDNGTEQRYLGAGPFATFDGLEGLLIKGQAYYAYGMRFKKNGVWYRKVDSVYVKSFETFTDTIYY